MSQRITVLWTVPRSVSTSFVVESLGQPLVVVDAAALCSDPRLCRSRLVRDDGPALSSSGHSPGNGHEAGVGAVVGLALRHGGVERIPCAPGRCLSARRAPPPGRVRTRRSRVPKDS